jgi:hypothetical protein
MNINRPADAGAMSEEERQAWIERVEARYAERRGRGVVGPEPSPDEVLAELESDHNAGRVLRFDVRISAEEKVAWTSAAQTIGISTAELVRLAMEKAVDSIANEVGEPVAS